MVSQFFAYIVMLRTCNCYTWISSLCAHIWIHYPPKSHVYSVVFNPTLLLLALKKWHLTQGKQKVFERKDMFHYNYKQFRMTWLYNLERRLQMLNFELLCRVKSCCQIIPLMRVHFFFFFFIHDLDIVHFVFFFSLSEIQSHVRDFVIIGLSMDYNHYRSFIELIDW